MRASGAKASNEAMRNRRMMTMMLVIVIVAIGGLIFGARYTQRTGDDVVMTADAPSEHDRPRAIIGDANEWLPPQREIGARFLKRERDACAFASAPTVSSAVRGAQPRLITNKVTTAALRDAFTLPALLKRSGKTSVQHAHPAYHIVAGGSVERMTTLETFIERYLRTDDVANVSFVFDSMSDVLSDKRLKSKSSGKSLVPRRLGHAVDEPEAVIPVLSVGGDGAGLAMHQHDATLLTLLHGYKLWLVAAPEVAMPDFVFDSMHGYGYMLLEDALKHRGEASMSGVRWCVQPPNTAVYLPGHWWHATVNLGEAVAFAEQLGGGFTPMAYEAAAATTGKQRAQTLSAHARDYMFKDKVDVAIKTAQEAIEVDPLQVMARFVLAESYARLKKAPEALQSMRDAAEAVRSSSRRATPPVPELFADSLLRIAYTLCVPLAELSKEAVPMGMELIREALEAVPTSLENNILSDVLGECSPDKVVRQEQ